MHLLDTNVLSELMRLTPDERVASWMARQTGRERFFTTAMSKAELLAGTAVLPLGRRRRMLEDACERVLDGFEDCILPFDETASTDYAEILVARQRAGRPIKTNDLIIAAIARANDATLVTRDIGDFELTGVPLVNPWDKT